MKKIKELILKYGSSLAAFAFVVNAMKINPNCHFLFHEPTAPAELNEFKSRNK